MSLELKNIEMKVGVETYIHPINLKLEKNTINVLLGSTLAGKTTLMQIIAGLLKPTSGEIWFNKKNVTGLKVQGRNVSMVYQQFINYPNFTVYENIASPLNQISPEVGLSRPAMICIKVVLPANVDPNNMLIVFFSNLRLVE